VGVNPSKAQDDLQRKSAAPALLDQPHSVSCLTVSCPRLIEFGLNF